MVEMLSSDEKIVQICDPAYRKLDVLAYITDFCGYGCWYCYNRVIGPRKHINLAELAGFARRVKTVTTRDLELELIGGEPSVHPDIEEFCGDACQFSSVVMYTNLGRDSGLYRRLANLGVRFDISYHEPDAKRNAKVLENIDTIPKSSIRGITVMLDKSRFDDNVRIFYELKTRYPDIDVDFQQIIIGSELDSYSDEQLAKMAQMTGTEPHGDFQIKTNRRTMNVSHNQIYEITRQKYKRWLCSAGVDLLYVHVDGKVYRCDGYFNGRMPSIGDIRGGIRLPSHPSVCEVENCPFQDNVTKRNVFGL